MKKKELQQEKLEDINGGIIDNASVDLKQRNDCVTRNGIDYTIDIVNADRMIKNEYRNS